MFGARPTFGGNSTFGTSFGTTTPSSTFGSSTFGRPTFGTPATSSSTLFGTNTTGGNTLFGQNQTSGGGLFGSNTQSTGFGTGATTQNTFGTSGGTMFGSTNQTTGLFGSSGTAFSSNQNAATRPFSFGTPAATGTSGGGLFGTTSNTSGGTLFNSAIGGQAAPTGTTVKFNPVTSSDTMNRGGVTNNIQTKIEVITAMKEYETKSLEELRVEDYVAGRKGSSTTQTTAGFGFGGNKFGTTPSATPLFGQTSSASSNIFGTKPLENKPFSTNTGFSFNQPSSAPTFGTMSQTNTQSGMGFGSTGFSFGNTQPTSAVPFGDNKLGFGNTGSSVNSNFFGSNKPPFGMSGTTSTSAFGKPAGFSTGFGTSTATGFGSSNTGTGLFAQNQAKPAYSFGTSTGTGFGTGSTGFGSGGGLFNQNATQNKPGTLSFGGGLSFGNPTPSTGFGFNQNTGTGLLGSNTGGGFFGNQNAGLNTSTTGFGTNFNSGFGMNNVQGNQQNMNNNNLSNLIKALTHNPFGNSSLLKSGYVPTGKADELLSAISGGDGTHEGTKNNISKKPHYVLPSSISIGNIAKPIGINRLANVNGKSDPAMNMLFAGLDESSDFNSDDPFKPKFFPRIKKLSLKVFKNVGNNQSNDSSILNEASVIASPIATPIGSPAVTYSSGKEIETPTGRPFTGSNEIITDIIKGRNNIKNLNIARKMPFNDTIDEYNRPKTQRGLVDDTEIETNKENASLSLLETTGFDSPPEVLNDSNVIPHPAGMKLTRSGYYTLPSMDDLKDMIDGDGNCLVENFTVGRYEYGNICFLGITKINGLDIDAIVHIVRKEVEVYPEMMDKPAVGEGLNKPSLVTLDCVWPVDKASREVITAEERLLDLKWTEYLEKQCLKMDASFVEFRLETGSWVFKVKHFSKYGLQEEEKQGSATGTQKNIVEKKNDLDKPIVLPTSTQSNLNSATDVTPVSGSIIKKANGSILAPSPQQGLNFSRLSEEMVFTPPTRKVFLDDDSIPMDEGIANEPDESASICPLSPSAERLTVASKISQRAMQNKKSHLFFDDDDFEEKENRGEKRSSFQSSFSAVQESNKENLFMGSMKKLMLGPKPFLEQEDMSLDISERILSKPDLTIRPEAFLNDFIPEITILDKQDKALISQREARTEYPLIPCEKSGEQSGRRLSTHLQDKIRQEQSLVCNLDTCISDSAAFMGRSFRVGWGPGLTLIHAGATLGQNILAGSKEQLQDTSDKEYTVKSFLFNGAAPQAKVAEVKTKEPFSITIEKLHLLDCANPRPTLIETELNPILKNYLEIVLDNSVIHGDDDIPHFAPQSGIDLLHSLAGSSYQEENYSRLATIFHLCVALWGKLQFYSPDLDSHSMYSVAQYRKEALSQWLENVSTDIVSMEVMRGLESEAEDGYLDAVFSHMSVRQVSEACTIAQQHGDYHLALLLSQVCMGSEMPRQIIKHQLQAWAESGADNYISKFRMSLYSLIAGLPTHMSSSDEISTCLGLDWKRSLGLHYWYFSPATSTIGEGLEMYEKAAGLFNGMDSKYCEEPRPPYAFECLKDLQVDYDICYHLIKLFVDPTHKLEDFLENSTITPDPMDFSGSWLIWCVLHSLGFIRISETKANMIHLSFASVLESQGHWNWASFVLMFIKEKHCREKELEGLLSRQLLIESHTENAEYIEKENFLIEKLKLPINRLQRLKAFRARYMKLYDEEAWYLLMDGDFNKAHKLVLDSIAPKAVINEDHNYLKAYLYKLRSAQNKIVDWSNGGAIFCAYIEILEQIDMLKASSEFSGREIEKLRPQLLSVCSKLNNIKCPTAVHRVAVSEMSRVAVSVLRAILGTDPDATRVLAQQVASLPLTHECALEELNYITHQYLMGSVMET